MHDLSPLFFDVFTNLLGRRPQPLNTRHAKDIRDRVENKILEGGHLLPFFSSLRSFASLPLQVILRADVSEDYGTSKDLQAEFEVKVTAADYIIIISDLSIKVEQYDKNSQTA